MMHESDRAVGVVRAARGEQRARSSAAPVWSRLGVAWGRLTRWEYWPAWAVYAPLAPWILYYGLRSGGVTTCTAANPAIPFGGLVGESKWDILQRLAAGAGVLSCPLPAGDVRSQQERLAAFVRTNAVEWPVILKPDVGERGTGVRLLRGERQANEHLERCRGVAMIAQEYHPGPFEAGVFYIRHPGHERGFIFSVTDKVFPQVNGDGRSTIAELIRGDARLRFQADVFLGRLGGSADRVPEAGERVPIGIAGNHCRGTLFRDGSGLATPELAAALDRVLAAEPGLCFGRFDVRYRDPEELRAGRGFKVIEFNGLLSEATHIYDPSYGFWKAQRILREQWRLAFEVGRANARRGHRVGSLGEIYRAVRSHLSRPIADAGSD